MLGHSFLSESKTGICIYLVSTPQMSLIIAHMLPPTTSPCCTSLIFLPSLHFCFCNLQAKFCLYLIPSFSFPCDILYLTVLGGRSPVCVFLTYIIWCKNLQFQQIAWFHNAVWLHSIPLHSSTISLWFSHLALDAQVIFRSWLLDWVLHWT